MKIEFILCPYIRFYTIGIKEMTKCELIKILEEINMSDDVEVVFPNVEFSGFKKYMKRRS